MHSLPKKHCYEQALERLENELIEDPEDKEMRHLFKTVDELMEGQAEQQKQAFGLLKMKQPKLSEYELLRLGTKLLQWTKNIGISKG